MSLPSQVPEMLVAYEKHAGEGTARRVVVIDREGHTVALFKQLHPRWGFIVPLKRNVLGPTSGRRVIRWLSSAPRPAPPGLDATRRPGAFHQNSGRVETYDFPSGNPKAVPYGVYDVARNVGWVSVGVSGGTAEFATATIGRWWKYMGKAAYPDAKALLITADCGGSNGYP